MASFSALPQPDVSLAMQALQTSDRDRLLAFRMGELVALAQQTTDVATYHLYAQEMRAIHRELTTAGTAIDLFPLPAMAETKSGV